MNGPCTMKASCTVLCKATGFGMASHHARKLFNVSLGKSTLVERVPFLLHLHGLGNKALVARGAALSLVGALLAGEGCALCLPFLLLLVRFHLEGSPARPEQRAEDRLRRRPGHADDKGSQDVSVASMPALHSEMHMVHCAAAIESWKLTCADALSIYRQLP